MTVLYPLSPPVTATSIGIADSQLNPYRFSGGLGGGKRPDEHSHLPVYLQYLPRDGSLPASVRVKNAIRRQVNTLCWHKQLRCNLCLLLDDLRN